MTLLLKKKNIDHEDETNSKSPVPSRILYKKYGGNSVGEDFVANVAKVNPPLVQSVIFYEFSRLKWGPRMFGIFENGRLEEFLDCRTLTQRESFIPEINREVARAFARFHSVKLPLGIQNADQFGALAKQVRIAKPNLINWLLDLDDSFPNKLRLEELSTYPLAEELEWCRIIEKKIKKRIVLANNDPNYLNILVLNNPPKEPDSPKVFVVDHDLTCYYYRGYDLGGHFSEVLFNWSGETTKKSGSRYPTEAEREYFLMCYQNECKKYFDDFDLHNLDSLDNLKLESDFYAMAHLLRVLTYFVALYEGFSQVKGMFDPLPDAMTLYSRLKKEFCRKYPHLA